MNFEEAKRKILNKKSSELIHLFSFNCSETTKFSNIYEPKRIELIRFSINI